MIEIKPKFFDGKRAKGYALDVHTIQSRLTGADEFGHLTFENERSPMGEALYQLKYRSDKGKANEIAETVISFVKDGWRDLDAVDFILLYHRLTSPVRISQLKRLQKL